MFGISYDQKVYEKLVYDMHLSVKAEASSQQSCVYVCDTFSACVAECSCDAYIKSMMFVRLPVDIYGTHLGRLVSYFYV